ncbi:hypothetical protein NO263_07715 [Gluconacetobacter entanii]|uniref:Uncharacterized protein n=2 Tax=Gluconacetobacter entanii TaxID=108528 RepID=A0ABT3K4W9_9PROT|nr:hypothetical protein [Gluconacetobacter entanii]MCW4590463.1 hypothetical protein [Gluconacetobacter entanii]MCW4593648.1 hypothetical protein [Gluconacetobacter entanii]
MEPRKGPRAAAPGYRSTNAVVNTQGWQEDAGRLGVGEGSSFSEEKEAKRLLNIMVIFGKDIELFPPHIMEHALNS